MERLPPLQSLYYFYVAASLGSFKQAAQALFVSSAAVSQQIRSLESWLDMSLFERGHREVTLTAVGKQLLAHTEKGFHHIERGIAELRGDPEPGKLAISTLASFAHQWLIPRLGEFQQLNPDLQVLLQTAEEKVDFSRQPIDLCVRFSPAPSTGLFCEELMNDVLYPVAHPMYLQQHGIEGLGDLARATLLEDTLPDMSWQGWFDAVGERCGPPQASLRYQGSQLQVEGALAVQGVALVRHSLAWRYVKQGTLVIVGDKMVRSRYRYYMVAPEVAMRRDKNRRFCGWLQQQADAFWKDSELSQLDVVDAASL
ncbi:LysR substrate-binding domain-containing protein [Aliagarivorans taiwanensis]|uniref:LysR substrate-binding domain-containing protein n=1 Tax=Aliagarivorans taiwanensis TaxID=561966 RepID=UPI00041DD4A1|nr:LysR substrate-binding domain-containing protein [Aliagarivorans taiwanensis]